jgi:hypothetical protein
VDPALTQEDDRDHITHKKEDGEGGKDGNRLRVPGDEPGKGGRK